MLCCGSQGSALVKSIDRPHRNLDSVTKNYGNHLQAATDLHLQQADYLSEPISIKNSLLIEFSDIIQIFNLCRECASLLLLC